MINNRNFYILLLLIILVGVGQMAQTIYVPGITIIARDLIVHKSSIQKMMAVYLLCYGSSQLIYGPLSDRIGRRPVILTGLFIFCLGTVLAMVSKSILFLIIACSIQGIGTGVGGVMARTLPRDLYNGLSLRQVNSLLNISVLISPLLAPLLGGILVDHLGWRACFAFLLLLSCSVSFFVWCYLPETSPIQKEKCNQILKFWLLLKEKKFNYYLLILVGGLAGIAVFETTSGVLLGCMGMTGRKIGLLFVLPMLGTFLGAWYVVHAIKQFYLLMWLAVISCLLAGVFILIPSWFNVTPLWSLLLPASLFFFGAGMIFPLATAGAMEPYPYLAGTAGSLIGAIQNIGSGAIASFSSLLPQQNQFNLGIIILIIGILIFLCWLPLSKTIHN